MNEHDGLEPTVAMPRIGPQARGAVPPPSGGAPPPNPPPPAGPRPLRFGNPVNYTLRRFLAFVLDFVIVGGVATMLLYGLIAINPFTGLPNNLEGGFDATLAMGLGIALLYLWVFEALFGTTLGKLAFALHVYAPRGRFVGFGRSLVRNVLRPLDLIVVGGVLAVLPGHRRLGDLFGGTVVAGSPLRAFSPLVGWLLLAGLCAVPFLVAGGTVTVLAVGAAFIEFIPPLIAHAVHGLLVVVTALSGAAQPAPVQSAAPQAAPTQAAPTQAPAAADAASALPSAAPPTLVPTPLDSAAPVPTVTG
jgi:uncharacterized RDD family membrane protein YckC